MGKCMEPKSTIRCLECIESGILCQRLYEIKDALKIRSLDECIGHDSKCFGCPSIHICLDLAQQLKKKGVV